MWPNSLDIDVSREMREKLEIYHRLLLKWQKAINLISPRTIQEAWIRHFADSAQLTRYIPVASDVSRESSIVADLGSGAGFPGLVLAMLRDDLDIHLIESDQRKCQFLKTVSRETGVNITVHNARIESCINDISPDYVTARALADVSSLLSYVAPWAQGNSHLECFFLKGAKVRAEVIEAEAAFSFDYTIQDSITDPSAAILHIRNVSRESS